MEESIKDLFEFGIINIDKPSGPTSFDTSEYVMKKLGLRKTSHFGTLDPKVTGVLPVALNRACKLTGYFLNSDKEYIGVMRMHEEVSLEKINEIVKENFVGKIKQTPPLKSSVKRIEREREIYEFNLFEKQGKDILFSVKCQGGTYVRTLCVDIGNKLGTGAHMLELRRIKAGIFDEEFSITLYEFEKSVEEFKKGNKKLLKNLIIPVEILIKKLYPVVEIKEDNLKQILTGKPLHKNDLVQDKGWKVDSVVCVFCNERFVGMYKIFRGKEIFAKSEFVMQSLRK